MSGKKWIYGGITVLASSIIIPLLLVLRSIYAAFESLRVNETAGIGAAGTSLGFGVSAGLLGLIGVLTGAALIIVGTVKARRRTEIENEIR